MWRKERKGPAWANRYTRKGFRTWLEKMVIDPEAQQARLIRGPFKKRNP